MTNRSVADAPPLTHDALCERWRALAPLADDERRAEIDGHGELIVAPTPSNRHQRITGWVGSRLQQALGGEVGAFALATRIGVRVPDVCWSADASRFVDDPAVFAPEICVEVASPGNSAKWLLEKAAAYLAAGAQEVVIVELDGRIRYFDVAGERPESAFGVALTLPPGA